MKLTSLRNLNRRVAAFSLTESVVGVAVMSIAIMSLYSGMAQGFQSIKNSQENLRATQILLGKFETIRLYNWEQINTPDFIPATFTTSFSPSEDNPGVTYYGKVQITEAKLTEPYQEDLRSVTIDLTWNSGRTTHHRSFTSCVARYGLQHYIY